MHSGLLAGKGSCPAKTCCPCSFALQPLKKENRGLIGLGRVVYPPQCPCRRASRRGGGIASAAWPPCGYGAAAAFRRPEAADLVHCRLRGELWQLQLWILCLTRRTHGCSAGRLRQAMTAFQLSTCCAPGTRCRSAAAGSQSMPARQATSARITGLPPTSACPWAATSMVAARGSSVTLPQRSASWRCAEDRPVGA